LRHIWQLCDVTRDGALDLAEFTAAMHLVVLRRNNIPIPSALPGCLQPTFLLKTLGLPQKEMTEIDLLQLESDDNQGSAGQKTSAVNKNDYQRMVSSTYDEIRLSSSGKSKINKSSTLPKNHYSQRQRVSDEGDDREEQRTLNNVNLNSNKVTVSKNVIPTSVNRSNSNSPVSQSVTDVNSDANVGNKKWTMFTESPTSSVSSPGPKPVNVTTSIIDPSHVIYPVPLRVTPVGMEVADEEAMKTFRNADTLVYESGVIKAARATLDREATSPKHNEFKKRSSLVQHQRDSLPNDLRAIQRPHPKKPASKNIGAIPLPPETNSNINMTLTGNSGTSVMLSTKKEVPPLPPPRYNEMFIKM
jgi:RalBP1-associated Eps domain-containing protein